jgi:hypothetical protein
LVQRERDGDDLPVIATRELMQFENVVPLRWPSGPLEIARREKGEGFNSQIRQTLERWHDPAMLEFLKDTAIDCIVISWAAGLAADAEQQRTAAPLIEAARQRNLAVVGWVDGTADHNAAIAAAKAAGLTAVAIRGMHGSSDFPAITWSDRADVAWDSTAPVVAIGGNVWPGVSLASGGADASAGPTGVPWLDSNGWYIQMARARLKAPLWVVFDPPAGPAVPSPQSYVKAICDSEAAGGRWVISLDDNLRSGLAAGNTAAWKDIASAAAFFKDHPDWKSYRSLGLVGVISNFAGSDFDLTGEILNLMARRDLLFRVIWKSQAMAQAMPQPFTGLKALIYADAAMPEQPLRRKITDFVEQGGLLITGPAWGKAGTPAPPDFQTQFDVLAVGKGRLAVARNAIDDPYQLAGETQLLLSHRNDLVKIYNSPSSGCTRYTASPDGKTALLQCLSYADGRRAGLRTIWVRDRHPSTRLWTIEAPPVTLDAHTSEDYAGVEYHLPANATQAYLALEFERQRREA